MSGKSNLEYLRSRLPRQWDWRKRSVYRAHDDRLVPTLDYGPESSATTINPSFRIIEFRYEEGWYDGIPSAWIIAHPGKIVVETWPLPTNQREEKT
jgi:hypothetical protein